MAPSDLWASARLTVKIFDGCLNVPLSVLLLGTIYTGSGMGYKFEQFVNVRVDKTGFVHFRL